MSALLKLHLHSQLNTWLQWIEQRQLQDETRNTYVRGLGAFYIREWTVCPYFLVVDHNCSQLQSLLSAGYEIIQYVKYSHMFTWFIRSSTLRVDMAVNNWWWYPVGLSSYNIKFMGSVCLFIPFRLQNWPLSLYYILTLHMFPHIMVISVPRYLIIYWCTIYVFILPISATKQQLLFLIIWRTWYGRIFKHSYIGILRGSTVSYNVSVTIGYHSN